MSLIRSNNPSMMMPGPMVINRYKSDGGYLVQFRNEATVKRAFDWLDQLLLSPYRFDQRKITNPAVSGTSTGGTGGSYTDQAGARTMAMAARIEWQFPSRKAWIPLGVHAFTP